MKFRQKLLSLPLQMVASLVGLVILTAIAIGIPSIWLIRSQLDQQAWTLVEQGLVTTRAVFSARQSHLNNLALLTAQRPALYQLLIEGDRVRLIDYLRTLQAGAGLDLVVLCDAKKEPVAQVGLSAPPGVCQEGAASSIYEAPQGSDHPVWLLSAQPIADSPQGLFVIVGEVLDTSFMSDLRDQTGLEQIFLAHGEILAGSFPEEKTVWQNLPSVLETGTPGSDQPAAANGILRGTFHYGSTLYYAIRTRFGEDWLEIILSRPVPNIENTQAQLTRLIGAAMLIVILASSGLGILLARRISSPLQRLRDAAIALRRGDLVTPVSFGIRAGGSAREIAQVAYALEDARIALYHSLTTLRQEKAWIDHLLESVVEGIFTLDRFGRVTFFSQGAERITGWRQEQVIGKPVDEVFRLADDGDSGSREGRSPGAGVPDRFSRSLPAPGGKPALVTVLLNDRRAGPARISPRTATLAITAAQLAPPEAGRAGTALVFRDVSDEDAIRRLLGDFLANITHEFRTPLSALAASTELLLDQLPSLSLEETRELLDSLRLGILGLQTLIDNLLEGASIEAGRFRVHPRPSGLAEIVAEVVRTMQPLFDKYGQRLAVDLPASLPDIQADPRRTGQVLVNLFSNAIKWSPAGSEITLSASSSEQGVKVMVGDQGPGILPEQKGDLFRRFAHLRSGGRSLARGQADLPVTAEAPQTAEASQAAIGAGLGLSVVKAIAEAQHGQVGVSDRAGGGAVFWFTVPIAAFGLDEQEERP